MDDCQGCPAYCCFKADGAYLLITACDINRLARFFGITDGEVRRKYMANRHSLQVRDDRSCIFFVPGDAPERCLVYEARPYQCRSFPHGEPCPYLVPPGDLI
ncbi:MAG: YkgJ family cysteine cluster protein [Desulfurivibrio sp.]|nr:MAG: YkgJ family cysteine cluster protein [Desulfurivibrio sp.]